MYPKVIEDLETYNHLVCQYWRSMDGAGRIRSSCEALLPLGNIRSHRKRVQHTSQV